MEIIGDRKFVEVPGDRTHELPPLLIRSAPQQRLKRNADKLERAVGLAANIVESEDLIHDPQPAGDRAQAGSSHLPSALSLAMISSAREIG